MLCASIIVCYTANDGVVPVFWSKFLENKFRVTFVSDSSKPLCLVRFFTAAGHLSFRNAFKLLLSGILLVLRLVVEKCVLPTLVPAGVHMTGAFG